MVLPWNLSEPSPSLHDWQTVCHPTAYTALLARNNSSSGISPRREREHLPILS